MELLLSKPLIFSLYREKYSKKNWHNLDIPRHFHIFSAENLNLLLEMHNLKEN